MEHYNTSPEISHTADPDPFQDYSEHLTEIEVTIIKSKRSIISEGMRNLSPDHPIVIFAEGSCISKAVSCCETIKTSMNRTTYQNTQLRGMRTVEIWLPLKADSGLDPLRVTRSVPIIYILLSLDPLSDIWSGLGFQKDRKDTARRKLTISESDICNSNSTASPPATLISKSKPKPRHDSVS